MRSIFFMLFFAASAFGASSVTLRDSVVLSDGVVTLADLAVIEGDEADELGAMVVFEVPPVGGVIDLETVRGALDDAGVNWGRVMLRGGACRVLMGAPRLAVPHADDTDGDELPGVVDLSGPETMRTRIARQLGELYGVENDDLRVRFDGSDAAFLDEMKPGLRYETVVESASSSERVPVRVTVFDGERVVASRGVRADVQIRKNVVMLRQGVDRGERFDAPALHAQERWVSPAGSPVVGEIGDVIGKLARTRLGAGTVVRESLIEKPVLVKRNELATVHCLNGSVSMRVRARAMEDGREGDVIEFRKDRRSEPFLARVSGAGIAVATADRETLR